jgi:hypothetical protein
MSRVYVNLRERTDLMRRARCAASYAAVAGSARARAAWRETAARYVADARAVNRALVKALRDWRA